MTPDHLPPRARLSHPLHTVYVPADAVDEGTVATWSQQALDTLDRHAGDAAGLAGAVGWPVARVEAVWQRLRTRLATHPVDDLRVDTEDGYGHRPGEVEDAHVRRAAHAAATWAAPSPPPNLAAGTSSVEPGLRPDAVPGFGPGAGPGGARPGQPHLIGPGTLGVRTRALQPATRARALRTIELFVAGLAERAGATRWVPGSVRWTLPKVATPEEVATAATTCEALESDFGLPDHTLVIELQVETPAAIIDPTGVVPLPGMINAGRGRVVGLHYGTYDYATALGIPPAEQSAAHPVADHAKTVMQVVAAVHGVDVSDGSSNQLPVGSTEQVHAAWRVHVELVQRAFARGLPAGWDLHPAQLVTRYLAAYDFYRRGLPAAAQRLRDYTAGVQRGVLDEPATARALARFLLAGWDCGAFDEGDVGEATGFGAQARTQLEAAAASSSSPDSSPSNS